MALHYDRLWDLLNKRGISQEQFIKTTGVSKESVARLRKDAFISTDVLNRICTELNCDLSDVVSFVNDSQAKKIYKMNSFFAGIGGFDVAFERSGFKTVFLCEINDYCNKVLSTHWPGISIKRDICTLQPDDLPDVEVWCGGFPCQDISVARGAAERRGLNGSQSGLFYQYAELIDKKKPEVVIIENVEGLFNSNKGRDFGVIIQKLTSMGYAVAWRLFNSRYFGVPQSRPRTYLCCWRNNPNKAIATMFDLEGAFRPEDGARKDFITEKPHSHGYPKVPIVSYCLAATSGRHTGTDWSRTYVVCEDGVRRMTPLEYERLQGFPDNWTLPPHLDMNPDEVDTLRYKAIGNAVSVPVVEWIAKRVYQNLSSNERSTFKEEDIYQKIPEFSRQQWSNGSLAAIDFTDVTKDYKWPKAGVAWKGKYIGKNIYPTPNRKIESYLIDIIEEGHVNERYYLTSNAAEGILRRVDNQRRTLFPPLRRALENEMRKGSGD